MTMGSPSPALIRRRFLQTSIARGLHLPVPSLPLPLHLLCKPPPLPSTNYALQTGRWVLSQTLQQKLLFIRRLNSRERSSGIFWTDPTMCCSIWENKRHKSCVTWHDVLGNYLHKNPQGLIRASMQVFCVFPTEFVQELDPGHILTLWHPACSPQGVPEFFQLNLRSRTTSHAADASRRNCRSFNAQTSQMGWFQLSSRCHELSINTH